MLTLPQRIAIATQLIGQEYGLKFDRQLFRINEFQDTYIPMVAPNGSVTVAIFQTKLAKGLNNLQLIAFVLQELARQAKEFNEGLFVEMVLQAPHALEQKGFTQENIVEKVDEDKKFFDNFYEKVFG